MTKTKISQKLRRMTVRTISAIITLAIIISTVTVLGLVSFAEEKEQMILISADKESNDIIIPIPKSDTLSGTQFYELTFSAKMLKGKKPVVGIFNITSSGTTSSNMKYKYVAQPTFVENEDSDGSIDLTGDTPQLYSKYDAKTMTYTAIIKMTYNKSISNSTDTAHHNIAGLLTIGNTEYGTDGTVDTSVQFVFARPQLKHMKKVGETWKTENSNAISLPKLTNTSIDFSASYIYTENEYKKAQIKDGVKIEGKKAFICAPIGVYSTLASIESNPDIVAKTDYNDKLSTTLGHNFTYVEEVEPTTETEGKKGYYTCDCGNCEGKYYSNELETSLIDNPDTLIIPATTEKMIVVEKNDNVSNIVVPLELMKRIEALSDPTVVTGGNETYDVYLKLKFKARMFTGTKPIIGVIGKNGDVAQTYKEYANNANDTATPELSCNYNADTLEYVAIIKATVNKNTNDSDFAITIGNAEHDGKDGFDTTDFDVSFAMTEPELYILNPSTKAEIDSANNLLNSITDYNTRFKDELNNEIFYTTVQKLLTAKKNDYSRDGENNTVTKLDTIENFFDTRHTFVQEPAIEPTAEKDGHKAYFYCKNCVVENCCFKDKKYLDKGYTSATDEELISKKFQMITIKRDNKTNVFVPLNLKGIAKSEHVVGGNANEGAVFVKIKFDARMINGTKPVISRIRGSSDLGGDYAYSEKDYVDNTNETPASIGTKPVLYTKYDENTGKFEAVVQLVIGKWWSTIESNDQVHDAILIGHSEHNDKYFTSETDTDVEFSFCNPEIYLLNASTGEEDTSIGNLCPPISEDYLNFGKVYKHDANPCKATNNVMSAPINKWSIEGNREDVVVADIPNDYFRIYKFVHHNQVSPTSTKTGMKAYYTCECGQEDCPAKGKYYTDKGITEVNKSELILTYSKMIKIGGGENNNVFIPVNLTSYVKSKHKDSSGCVYLRIRFKARMFEGKQPIVSRVRGSNDLGGNFAYSEPDYVDNDDNKYDGMVDGKPDLYCEYNESTGEYTAIIRLDPTASYSKVSNGIHDAILIGNAEHNGKGYTSETSTSTSFAFCDPELYLLDISDGTNAKVDDEIGNIISPITEETLNFGTSYAHNDNPCKLANNIMTAPINKWSIDGSTKNITAESIPDDKYFTHYFIYHEKVNPTRTSTGSKAYYTCGCEAEDCPYKDKKYSDKGIAEMSDIFLGKTKMITVGNGSNNNVYVPIDISSYAKSNNKYCVGNYSYLRIRFKARMISGDKPVVSRVRGSSDKVDSQGNPIQGSWDEPYYVDNVTSEGGFDNDGNPILYSSYNEATCEYTAIIKLGTKNSWSTLKNGVHDAILIGNAEHNGKGYTSETNSDVSFSFCEPELYFINSKQVYVNKKTGATKASLSSSDDVNDYVAPLGIFEETGNLIAPICDETLNLNKSYKHYDNPCSYDNHLLSAPKDMWSVDGDYKNVSASDYDDNYFKYYNFVFHKQVSPTSTTTGKKAHYTCECGDDTCVNAGKFFTDKGITEVSESDLLLGTSKMILLGSNPSGKSTASNLFVPLNLKPIVEKKHKDASGYVYVRLTFKARMLSGSYPIVSRVRGSSDKFDDGGNPIQGSWSEPSYTDNVDHTYDGFEAQNDAKTVFGPDLYSEYNPDTMEYTTIIKLQTGVGYSTLNNGIHDAILIGNANHNGKGFKETDYNVSFVFSDPELYLLDISDGKNAVADTEIGNLIAPICNETLNFDKDYEHYDNPCAYNNHLLSAPKDMWSIDGNRELVSAYDIPVGYFEPGKDSANAVKITNGASDSIISTSANLQTGNSYKVDIDYISENGGEISAKYMLLNANNTFVSASDMGVSVDTPIDNVKGKHYSAVITLPSSANLGKKGNNFKLIIGTTGGTVKLSNVSVKTISISGKYGYNAILNGDFRRSVSGGATFSDNFPFWNVENFAEESKITTESASAVEFADTTPKAIFVNNTKGTLSTKVSLKSSTKYVLRFCSKYNSDTKAKPYVALNTTSGTKTDIGSYSNDVGDIYNTVYTFTTPSNMAGGRNANIGVNIASTDISGAISGFELYEISSNGSESGDNLIKDSYLTEIDTASSIWEKSSELTYTAKTISIYYFKILKSNLLVFAGRNYYDSVVGNDGHVIYGGNQNGYIETTATVENNKQYIFSVNYKFADEGYDPTGAKVKIGPEVSLNYNEKGFKLIDVEPQVSKDEYKDIYIFTATNVVESNNNFKFKFNIPGALTSGYISNATLREYDGKKAVGEELLENGSFSTGDYSGWTKSGSNFYQFNFCELPENFFSKSNPIKPSMVIFSNPTDYAQIMQHFMVKPETSYEVRYKLKTSAQKYDDKPPHISLYKSDYNKDDDGNFVLKSDGRNVESSTVSMPNVYSDSSKKDDPKYQQATRITYTSKDDSKYTDPYNQIVRFTTSKDIYSCGDGNIILRLYMRSGTAGYWGDVEVYELDENGKAVGNNILLNGDFSLGLTAWMTTGTFTTRFVEQPTDFFTTKYKNISDTMVYSNGTLSNQTYGNTFKLKKGVKYYFTGNYVNMNAQGVTPEIKYLDKNGQYKMLQTNLVYDADRYYFEIEFEVPDDALFVDGLAKVIVQMNNGNKGKGYFTNLSLTGDGKYINMFDSVGFIGANSNYKVMPYDANVFVFYFDDTAFDDGDWSGEASLTASDAHGVVMDEEGNYISGIRMVLKPLNAKSETDIDGNYSFNNLTPGKYSLYLVSPKTKQNVFCISFDVEECQSITLPMIIYSKITDTAKTDGDISSKDKAIIQCLLFDENGTRLSDIPIFIEDNGFAVTNKKGIATFDNLTGFGEKKIYINLDNGKKYVFRKVNVVAGKGTRIKLMYKVESQDNTLLYILIFGGVGLIVLACAVFAVIMIIKRKKAKIKVA